MSSSAASSGTAEAGPKPGPDLLDDETARQKMRDAEVYDGGIVGDEYGGFDPDNVADIKLFRPAVNPHPYSGETPVRVPHAINPMGYFARRGDLPMMRWLHDNGADTRDVDVVMYPPMYSPMYLAALKGHLCICKWLFQHGAAGDVTRRASNGLAPLSVIFHHSNKRDLTRWLILTGALCTDGVMGDLNIDLMISSLNRYTDSAVERRRLLEWAREHHQSWSFFRVFLMGTLSALTYSAAKLRDVLLARIRSTEAVDRLLRNTPPDQYPLLWHEIFPRRDGCPLAAFCGKRGVLELIADYVGILRGREARIVRQLAELLPGVIAGFDRETAARELAAARDRELRSALGGPNPDDLADLIRNLF